MRKLGFSALFLVAATAFAAAPMTYNIETVVKKAGKTETMQMNLNANKSGEITATDSQSKNGTSLHIKAEPVDADTVLLSYVIKDIQNGKETIVGKPEVMVFLDQSAEVADYGMTVTVRRK
ncbi:MAG: hypothetical protein ACAH59_00995 [Pseudobdellovibrionaceae bacterium]